MQAGVVPDLGFQSSLLQKGMVGVEVTGPRDRGAIGKQWNKGGGVGGDRRDCSGERGATEPGGRGYLPAKP